MKAVSKSLAYEVKRQTRILERGGAVDRETRLWDDAAGRSERMRSKEEAHDYRYFPEPDLVPFELSDEDIERLRAQLPELAAERRRRFVEQYSLGEYDAQVLTDDRAVADYFEQAVKAYNSPKSIAHWIMNDVLAILNEQAIAIAQFELAPDGLAALIKLADEKTVTAQAARDVMRKMIETGKDAASLVKEMGAETIADAGDLAPVIEEALAQNEKAVRDYLKGKKTAMKALVGQVMRISRGKADPALAAKLLQEKLDEMQDPQ